LHAGKDALDAAQDDVSDQAVAGAAVRLFARAVFEADGAFQHQVLQAAVFDDGHADFPGSCVDQDVLLHIGCSGNSDGKR
jgi:hypothetical protein